MVLFSFKFVYISPLRHCVIPFSPTYYTRIDVRGETAPEWWTDPSKQSGKL